MIKYPQCTQHLNSVSFPTSIEPSAFFVVSYSSGHRKVLSFLFTTHRIVPTPITLFSLMLPIKKTGLASSASRTLNSRRGKNCYEDLVEGAFQRNTGIHGQRGMDGGS